MRNHVYEYTARLRKIQILRERPAPAGAAAAGFVNCSSFLPAPKDSCGPVHHQPMDHTRFYLVDPDIAPQST
jgi:hypothetical protein